MDLASIGRLLVIAGLVIAGVGLLLTVADRVPLIGRLPGDINVRGDGWQVYAPLGTSLLISVVLTLVLTLFLWLGRR